MKNEIKRVIHSNDIINQINLVHEKQSGIYLATLLEKEKVTYFNKDATLLVISIANFGTYNIIQPKGKGLWNKLQVGNIFIINKQVYKDKKTNGLKVKTIVRYIVSSDTTTNTIKQVSLDKIPAMENMYPGIIQLAVLDKKDDEYLIYARNYIYQVKADFVFDNYNNVKLTYGQIFYADKYKDSENKVKVLSTDFNDAVKLMQEYTTSEQTKEEKLTFKIETKSKDKFIDYNKISNIDLINRDYSGMLLLDVMKVTTSMQDNKKRRYLDAIVNGGERVTLRIPERVEWQGLRKNQSLLVNKTIHQADDGKPLALLDMVLRVTDFADQEAIDMDTLTKHKNGLMSYVDFKFIKKIDEYYLVLSRYKLHKISAETLPTSIGESLELGYTMFSSKIQGNDVCYGREEVHRVKLCK